jgi:hypothetical protein
MSFALRSLAEKFQKQLNDLMNTLNNTEPHYIRCVKPNARKGGSELSMSLSADHRSGLLMLRLPKFVILFVTLC